MKDKTGITRFAVLPDERRLLLGIDKDNLFEAGYVYEATKILDQIVIRKVDKYYMAEKGTLPCNYSEANSIIYHGYHLITKEEMKSIVEKETNGKS
jgi:hypothetical protein